MKEIIIGGGCFWGVEAFYTDINGVVETKCVYVNGNYPNPTYEQLKHHQATHAEGVYIKYDENAINLSKILALFLRFVDPYSVNVQGEDVGIQYRSGLYPFDEITKSEIIKYLKDHFKDKYESVKIEIVVSPEYYLAEEYHQQYLKKNPGGYCHVDLELIQPNEKKVK
jgi:peptide-methionine (S)-S-oxide reductase